MFSFHIPLKTLTALAKRRTVAWKKTALALRISALFAAIGLAGYFLLPFAFPIPETLAKGKTQGSTVLLDRHGEQLDHFVRPDYYRHRVVSLDDIPSDLIQATLAAEDKRFYDHGGVDLRATMRAAKDSYEAGRFVSGASTITQQTVKLSQPKVPRNFTTKLRECLTARHVEMSIEKNDILAAYFNRLDYGNRSQGPLQAARHYFQKPLHQLSLAECALLAGLPQAPSRLNPRRNPSAALKRRDWILDRMAVVYNISPDRIERAKQEPLQLRSTHGNSIAPHLRQLIGQNDRTAIRTSLDAELQRDLTKIIHRETTALADKHIHHAGLVVIDNPSGQVLAMIGSPHFGAAPGTQIDATQTPRSPGSALKPFTYLLAFDHGGMTPATIIPDIPTQFSDTRVANEFVNYSRRHHGPVTIHHALGNSYNIPAVRTLNTVGGAPALLIFLQKFGIRTLNQPPIHYGLGLTLGSGDVRLLELTNAYAGIARMGLHAEPRFLVDDRPLETTRVADVRSCWMLAQSMSSNQARSSAFGSRSNLRLPFPCAVKTGTSTDFRDNWCIGFTANYTIGVWVGNLNNSPMRGISGVTGAGPIFRAAMLRLHRDCPPQWFPQPDGMRRCFVHRHTGKLLTAPAKDSLSLFLPTNRLPLPSQDSDFDTTGRVLLDQRYTSWFGDEADHSSFALREETPTTGENLPVLRILSPSREARYMLDPDLPNRGQKLTLSTDFPGKIHWSSPTLEINTNTATLVPGKHTIYLKDQHGRTSARHIVVEEL